MSDYINIVFLNNTVLQWLIAAAFIIGGFFAGKLVSLVIHLIMKVVFKTKKNLVEMIHSLEKPLALLVFQLGLFIGLENLSMSDTVKLWTGRVLHSFLIIIITWALTRVANAAIARFNSLSEKNEMQLLPLLQKFASLVLWFIAIALILRGIGYNISALMAGLGLGGAAIALASKDTLANFFGSFTVFMDRPFRLNDRIKISGYDGIITEMGIRTSRLRTWENRTVFIPNGLFATMPIENVSSEPSIKVVQTIGFKGDNGSEKIDRGMEIMREITANDPRLEGQVCVSMTSVSSASCQTNFVYFVSKDADYNETVNYINMEMLRRFEKEGIQLA
ncbi:MAG TPA: mechanosensitive ion channel protein MscS [Treponema sp.]|nr:mechanosensitive ion channel protein MscS [Treponema sp.]